MVEKNDRRGPIFDIQKTRKSDAFHIKPESLRAYRKSAGAQHATFAYIYNSSIEYLNFGDFSKSALKSKKILFKKRQIFE